MYQLSRNFCCWFVVLLSTAIFTARQASADSPGKKAYKNLLQTASDEYVISKMYNRRTAYLVSKVPVKFNIKNVDKKCEMHGGYLVELDDESELDFVNEVLRDATAVARSKAPKTRNTIDEEFGYIGANDIEKEGEFVNIHSGKPLAVTAWDKIPQTEENQPNNYQNQDCGAIRVLNGKLHDIPCDLQKNYICEVPLVH